MKGRHVGEFEEFVLLAVGGLHGEAYGVPVQQLLEDETGRSVSLGAVYAALERLERKGLLRSTTSAGTPTRGGRRRRQFELTAAGVKTIEALQRIRARLYRVHRARSASSSIS